MGTFEKVLHNRGYPRSQKTHEKMSTFVSHQGNRN